MRDFLKSKLDEADSIIGATDDAYDSVQRCEDLRRLIDEVATEAIKSERPEVLDLCQSVRRDGVSLSILRSVLVRCLAALPPERPAPLMTADEVASLLNVSVRSVWRMRSAAELPEPLTFGKSIRWRQSDIEKITKG